jgi:hypothetical protein
MLAHKTIAIGAADADANRIDLTCARLAARPASSVG